MAEPAGADPFDPAEVLPHRGVSLYVRRVLDSDESSITCRAAVDPASPFRRATPSGDVVPAWLGLEMGAQAAAAHESVTKRRAGGEARPTGVFVVRCRAATFERPWFDADAELVVTARLTEAAPPLRTYHVRVEAGGAAVAEGRVSTFAH
jgi:predicted hotdog family 3-hydroxylacyl-ACP dehydratase